MTIIQLQNIFTYTGIMLLDNDLSMTSPDYFEEKSIKFFGKLGKSEFIQFPKIKYKYNTGKNFLKNYHKYHDDFWMEYCRLWNVRTNNYELMNCINFLLNILPPYKQMKPSITINNFEKYIGSIDSVENIDLSYMAHAKLREYFVENINLNDRYCKLRILESL
jgi:hypothetical protein